MTSAQEHQTEERSHFNTYELTSKSKIEHLERLTPEDFKAWLLKESKYWSEICQTLNNQKNSNQIAKTHSSVIDGANRYLNHTKELASKLEPNLFYENISTGKNSTTEFIRELFEFDFPHHDDPVASEFKNACHAGEATSVLYTYRALSKLAEAPYLRGWNEGVSKNLKGISDAIDDRAAETLTGFKEQENQLQEKFSNAEERLTNIVKAATSAIALSEPVKFWNERKGIHNLNAQKYGRYATWSAVIFSALLALTVAYEYISGTPHSVFGYEFTLPKSLSGIATIILISTAGIWSTRIFVKLMMANLTLETESIERATMIKTFVAMKAVESSIAQEAELLFYTTLFRPSNNVISEESTAPEFGKILDAILKAKPDKPAG